MEGTESISVGTTPSPAVPATATAEPTPAQRPSFADAFATDAARQTETTAPPEAATTAQAVVPDPAGAKEGPIPFTVHKTALDNARLKEREAVEAAWKPYEWAKQVPQESLSRMSNIANRMRDDPMGFLDSYFSELQNHPVHGQQVRSWAAKTLGSKQGRADTDVPDVEIVGADNQVIGNLRDIVDRITAQRLGPIEQTHKQLQERERVAQQTRDQAEADAKALNAQVESVTNEVLELVEGEAHLEAVTKVMVEHPDWSPRKCALFVRDEQIVTPRLSAQATATAIDTLKTKAAAQAVNPSAAAVASTHRPKSFSDPNLKWS